MNSPELAAAARLTAWQRELSSLTVTVRERLAADSASGRSSRTLWWGGGYSDLLPVCAQSADGEVLVADVDPRRLRRSGSLAGEQARTVRLLALADLRRDTCGIESAMAGAALRDIEGYLALEEKLRHRFENTPAVPDGWASRVVMDFTVNRVDAKDEAQLLAEAFRVMDRTGCLVSATLVSDEPLPSSHTVRSAPSGPPLRLPTEASVLQAFEDAGFHGIKLHWAEAADPLALDRIGDADIRMCIVEAYKGKQGPCLELGQAIMYCGPWREVHDDDGHVYRRGQRVSVCAKTYDLMMRAPYQGALLGLRSVNEPPVSQAELFDCNTPALRDPKVTKGLAPFTGSQTPAGCVPGNGCC